MNTDLPLKLYGANKTDADEKMTVYNRGVLKGKIIIYNKGKEQSDFNAIFRFIKPAYYITLNEDEYSDSLDKKENVFSVSVLKKEIRGEFYVLIACEQDDYATAKDSLNELGLSEYEDFEDIRNIFYLLDFPEEIWTKRIIVDAKDKLNRMRDNFCWHLGAIDVNKKDEKTMEIINGYSTNDEKALCILLELTIKESSYNKFEKNVQIYEYHHDNKGLQASEMMLKMINSPAKYASFCTRPFQRLDIYLRGACLCCFIPPVGDFSTEEYKNIWNNVKSQIIRQSIYNGTFCFCPPDSCGYLLAGYQGNHLGVKKDSPYFKSLRKNKPLILYRPPDLLYIGHESHCNLMCRSCPKNFLHKSNEDKIRINKINDNLFKSDLLASDTIILGAEGEVFANKCYLNILKNHYFEGNSKLGLQTNGTLLDEKMWNSIGENRNRIASISVSIDAATRETYKLLRGGDFDKLSENLLFISSLRKKGAIQLFQINFVTQNDNYREMPLFAEFGKQLGVDRVVFTRLNNWGSFTDDEYKQHDVINKSHMNNGDLQNILALPIFKEKGIEILF